jgi:acyl CoA:acetate/3-ketoacid CoA transferase alpha subunit
LEEKVLEEEVLEEDGSVVGDGGFSGCRICNDIVAAIRRRNKLIRIRI